MMRILTRLSIALLITMIVGCKSGGDSTPPTAAELVSQGWQAYAAKDYHSAADKFNQALGMDPNLVDAYNGAGWATAKLNQLSTAFTKLTAGLTKDAANVEIKAALSIVYNAQRVYAQSIDYAGQVISAQPNWSFSHDATVSASDLHILLAEDHFAMAEYAASLAEVKIINGAFDADVSTVAGQTALAQEIERLRSLV